MDYFFNKYEETCMANLGLNSTFSDITIGIHMTSWVCLSFSSVYRSLSDIFCSTGLVIVSFFTHLLQ